MNTFSRSLFLPLTLIGTTLFAANQPRDQWHGITCTFLNAKTKYVSFDVYFDARNGKQHATSTAQKNIVAYEATLLLTPRPEQPYKKLSVFNNYTLWVFTVLENKKFNISVALATKSSPEKSLNLNREDVKKAGNVFTAALFPDFSPGTGSESWFQEGDVECSATSDNFSPRTVD